MGPQWALIIFKQRSLREDFEEKKKKTEFKKNLRMYILANKLANRTF